MPKIGAPDPVASKGKSRFGESNQVLPSFQNMSIAEARLASRGLSQAYDPVRDPLRGTHSLMGGTLLMFALKHRTQPCHHEGLCLPGELKSLALFPRSRAGVTYA